MTDSRDDGNLSAIRAKLDQFEKTLKNLLQATENDLEIARLLQRALMPNRLPEIPGLKALARYIPSGEVSAECFDIIPTDKGKFVWVVCAWTETFGLSSVLLQSLMHLQGKQLVEGRSNITLEEVYDELSLSLSGAKKNAGYRLLVAKLDMTTLQISGLSQGYPPPLLRSPESAVRTKWDLLGGSALEAQPTKLGRASSATPTLSSDAHAFTAHVTPGTQLYFLGFEWNKDAPNLEQFYRPLELGTAQGQKTQDLLATMNHLLIAAQAHLKSLGRMSDLCLVSLEVDAKRLHLA